MDELFKFLMQGEVTSTGLLVLLLFLVISGRLVPWWQVSEMKEKLKAYEDKAPELLKEVQVLIELQKEENERARSEQRLPYDFIQRARPRNRPHARPRVMPPRKGGDT